MAADDTYEFLTPPDSDGDERLGHAPDFDEAEWDLGALEREIAAGLRCPRCWLLLPCDHQEKGSP